MAQAQEHAEMSIEAAEGAIARGMAELPEVAAAYYGADGDTWDLTVLHDYDGVSKGIIWVTFKLNEIRKKVPHLYIRPMILPASDVPPGDMSHDKLIYERQ